VHELVFRLGTRGDRRGWNEIAGLAGSRYQKLVVQELEQQMSGPDIALTNDYLYILGKQKLQLDHDPLPPYPQKDAEQREIWNGRMQVREKELKELQDSLYEKTAMLVAGKRGEARAQTVQTLLLRPSNGVSDVKALAGLPPGEVAAAFLNLSQDQQWNLLMSFWERLKDPAMSAPLKKVAEQSRAFIGSKQLGRKRLRLKCCLILWGTLFQNGWSWEFARAPDSFGYWFAISWPKIAEPYCGLWISGCTLGRTTHA